MNRHIPSSWHYEHFRQIIDELNQDAKANEQTIEKELALSESLHRLALKERDHEREINRQLLNALHQISLASQNNMSSQRECGVIARAAIAKVGG